MGFKIHPNSRKEPVSRSTGTDFVERASWEAVSQLLGWNRTGTETKVAPLKPEGSVL